MKLSANMACVLPALIRNSITALTLATLVAGAASMSTAATAAEGCDPRCPAGQVCAFKNARGGNGEMVCKTPIIINCPTDDPLCGLKNKKGPSSLRIK